MCLLPTPCLKFIVSLAAFISIVIAIGLLAITIYITVDKKVLVSVDSESLINFILIALYLSSITFLAAGICGLYASIKYRKQSNNCLFGCYLISVLLFFLIFTSLAIFFFVGPQAIFGDDCTNGSKTNLISDLYKFNQNASSLLCSQQCPCKLANDSYLYSKLVSEYNRSIDSFSETGVIKYQDCQNKTQDSNLVATMAAFEDFFKCIGWCSDGNLAYFKFTDIGTCDSYDCISHKDRCYQSFENFMKDKGKLAAFVSLGAALISLITIISICCLCCGSKRSQKTRNFYSLMSAS